MGKNIKYKVMAVLAVVALSLVLSLPTHAEPGVEAEPVSEVGAGVEAGDEAGGEAELGGGVEVGGAKAGGETDGEVEAGGETRVEGEAGVASVDGEENPAVLSDVRLLSDRVVIRSTFMVKFMEVGESITVTDELADSFEVSEGMPVGPMSAIMVGDTEMMRGALRTAQTGVTVEQGEGGAWTITANVAGSYTVFLKSGDFTTTTVMLNAIQFTATDDPTLSEIINNFKTAMKAIEEAMNSGDFEAMQTAWQGYMDAMKADAEKFYGLEDYDRMMALMRVMSMLINGEDLVVEQYTYQYTEEDFAEIYEYDDEYAAVLDGLAGALAEIGYTENISVYDIDLAVYNMNDEPDEDGERYPIAWLNNLSEERMVVLEVAGPEDGYERHFVAARAHFEGYERDEDGNYVYDEDGDWIPVWSYTVLDNVEFDPATGILGLWSDKFSVFAVAYQDVLVPKTPETGALTSESGSAETSASTMVLVALVVVAMAGALKFAKR